jgi:hypothetical protein
MSSQSTDRTRSAMGLMLYALTAGRRDFVSVGALQAERYDIVVDDAVADEAARLLSELTAQPPASPDRPPAAERPSEAPPPSAT